MSNTVMQIKRFDQTGNVPGPGDISYGELALNYADEKLYFKNDLNQVKSIYTPDVFQTVNVGGTLLLPTSPTDILTIVGANGVSVSGNSTTDKITIGETLSPIINVVFDQANAAYAQANAMLVGPTGPQGPSGPTGPTPVTTVYTANSITLTNGVYVSGNLYSVQVFNDGDYYTITDGSNTGPAWIITTDFVGVSSFNEVDLNINYTNGSGHTIYIQLYNNGTATWDNIGQYSGLSGFTQFQLGVISGAPYINAGVVSARL